MQIKFYQNKLEILKIKSLILYFILLILRILLNLNLDTGYKCNKFFKTLLKFVLNKKNGIVTFNLSFMLLPAKIGFILEK